jgi:hypothetical protein
VGDNAHGGIGCADDGNGAAKWMHGVSWCL